MRLVHNWSGLVTLPALRTVRKKVGRNLIKHSPTVAMTINARLTTAQWRGYWLMETELPPPFANLLVREPHARRLPVDCPVLTPTLSSHEGEGQLVRELRWEDAQGILDEFDRPENVTNSWANKFTFREEDEESEQEGLRMPQSGALHAICAHFAVGEDWEHATVVLPTGTGKTDVMIAALAALRVSPLLVLVPSDVLRTQIAAKFEEFGLVRKLRCMPCYACSPKVATLRSGMRSIEEAQDIIAQSNVIVALPNTLEASQPDSAKYLIKSCNALFVDEAHHLGAPTWQKIRNRFDKKRVVQFTATPFRTDGKHIGGKIIFNYKLSEAQADGYYKPIRLFTVEEFGDLADCDETIAKKAIAVLREDRERHDHLLLARARNRKKADQLLQLYRQLAPDLNPIAIYSGPGRKAANRDAFAALRARKREAPKIVVCVNMFGEGFDLPRLKVAAVHDNHKSLAVTLQFIGRFTRTATDVGEAGVIVNIADPLAEKRLEELYAEGADWDHLISRLSEKRIDQELHLQETVEKLKSSGNLHQNLSLWNLRPRLTAQVFRTKCDQWRPSRFTDAFPKGVTLWHSISSDPKLLIVVARQEADVKWGTYEDIQDTYYDLLVAYWLPSKQTMFISASDYSRMNVLSVADTITSAKTRLLAGPEIFNVLDNIQLPLAKNLGSSRIGAISFTSYFGPNVTEGLASIEKSESELNYIGCLGYEDGERVLWGAAQKKAKIWQREKGSIDDWMRWCRRAHQKLVSSPAKEDNITRDFLRPQKLETLHKSSPISVQWGEYLQTSFSHSLAVLFGNEPVPLFLADTEIEQVTDNEIRIAVVSEKFRSIYAFQIAEKFDKGYNYALVEGPPVAFQISQRVTRDFSSQMYVDPFIFRYADGTFSYNNFHIPFDIGATSFPAERLEEWDWGSVPLNEESMGITEKRNTIQYAVYERLYDEFDIIINDDGPGEAADLVCLKEAHDEAIELCLVHCKGAHGAKVSSDINNLYTVCGQAQKSIVVKHEGLKNLLHRIRRRHQQWRERGGRRLLKGNLKALSAFVNMSRKRPVRFEVIIVQPGLSRESLTDAMAKLLATTELFLVRTTEASFRVVCS